MKPSRETDIIKTILRIPASEFVQVGLHPPGRRSLQ
jgi:hypothetical protein